MHDTAPDPRRWKALALLCSAFFMVVLDVAIVNVALPSIGTDLQFAREDLQWVVTAYTLTFGGLLLLGGRAADLLGRRSVFMVGVALFTLASLACGLADSDSFLIGARAVQGIGAAIVSPAALSIITTTFTEGSERNKALGAWGGVGGSGAAAGVLFGGILTKYLGWEWIFFVNLFVGVGVFALTPVLVRESRVSTEQRRYDPLGALSVTASLVALVYAISQAPAEGWGSFQTIGLLVLSALLMAAFLVIESRAASPLMPLGIFRNRLLSAANVIGFLLGAALFGMFFSLTFYMQSVLDFSALQTGIGFLATAGTSVIAAGFSQALVTRVGPRPVMLVGFSLLTFGLLWYTQIDADGSYVIDLLPGFVATGIGLAFCFIPVSIAALAGVEPREAGLASGLINTSQQIGGAIGVAVVSTVATTHTATLLADGTPPPEALTGGFRWAFWVGAAIAAAGLASALLLIRGKELPADAATLNAPA
ncbi:MAG: MFS transporter [Actinobacteria bacterium]|nr:MFS transporter [Actinomycetota bacterium]